MKSGTEGQANRMTIEELYDYAKATGKENYTIKIQYQDAGGLYDGSGYMESIQWFTEGREVILS